MANYNTVITNEGAALLASVIANHGTITFTNLKLSENDYTGQEATLTEGTFDGIFANVSVASSIVDITTIKVSATVHGYNFSGDHNLYALGVIGTDGNTTALIAVCTTTNPDVLRDNSSTYAFNINLTVSSTSDITVVGTTAAVLYDIDVVDTLTSTATNNPLSANQGRLIGDNLAANENVYGAKNLWNIEKWLNDIGQAFTKSGDVYTTTISDARTNTNKCVFSDTDIEVTLSAELTASGSMQFYVELFDSNDNNVGSISLSNPTFTGIGCKVRFNFNNTGTVTLTAPMIRDARIIDPTFAPYAKTNQQLTADKAERSDLATLNLTGSTNTTGSTINAGTFFYLNGQFCKALTNIAANATFTENTNYKKDTVGDEIKTLNTSLSGLSVEVANGTFQNTQADTYEDTGITFQALGAHLHVVLTSWISGKPTGLKVVATDNVEMVYETTGTYAECLVFANVETKTFRLYSKRGSTPINPNTFTVKRINL